MADALTGGELAVRSLAAHGVELVFGIPGTHNLELYAHLERNGIRHVLPRHEQGAGYAADGYARVTGRPGVAITTTGPALMNIATAAGQAHSDSVPMLVISPGMPLAHPRASTGYLHEMPSQQRAMAGTVDRSVRVMSHAELARELADAFAAFASRRPRARHIEIPLDLLVATAPAEPVLAPDVARAAPPPATIVAAAERLRGARRPAIVAGGGAAGAAAELARLAERLGAPVLTSTNGKGTLPEDHPLALGARMNLPSARALLKHADVVLAVGTELAESDIWGPPLELDGALIRLDLDPAQAHGNNAAAIALIGDAAAGVAGLLAELGAGAPAGGEEIAVVRARLDAEHGELAAPWTRWIAALHGALDDDATVVGDNAMCCYNGAIGGLPVRRPRAFLFPTGFGTLGWSLPAAIGVALARPQHRTVAICGDGGLMFSLPELASAAALGLALPVVVFVNEGYGEIRKEMKAAGFDPLAVDIEPPDILGAARALGCAGAHAAEPEALGAELAAAFERSQPTVITVPEERA